MSETVDREWFPDSEIRERRARARRVVLDEVARGLGPRGVLGGCVGSGDEPVLTFADLEVALRPTDSTAALQAYGDDVQDALLRVYSRDPRLTEALARLRSELADRLAVRLGSPSPTASTPDPDARSRAAAAARSLLFERSLEGPLDPEAIVLSAGDHVLTVGDLLALAEGVLAVDLSADAPPADDPVVPDEDRLTHLSSAMLEVAWGVDRSSPVVAVGPLRRDGRVGEPAFGVDTSQLNFYHSERAAQVAELVVRCVEAVLGPRRARRAAAGERRPCSCPAGARPTPCCHRHHQADCVAVALDERASLLKEVADLRSRGVSA